MEPGKATGGGRDGSAGGKQGVIFGAGAEELLVLGDQGGVDVPGAVGHAQGVSHLLQTLLRVWAPVCRVEVS